MAQNNFLPSFWASATQGDFFPEAERALALSLFPTWENLLFHIPVKSAEQNASRLKNQPLSCHNTRAVPGGAGNGSPDSLRRALHFSHEPGITGEEFECLTRISDALLSSPDTSKISLTLRHHSMKKNHFCTLLSAKSDGKMEQ